MKDIIYTIVNLQMFAVQTTLLDDPGNDLSPENKTFYDKTLLMNAKPNLVHEQFGQKRPIPKNGGKTIEFRRFTTLAKATTPLTEGVTPSGNVLDVTAITATVKQYGDYIEQSDVLELTAIDKTVTEAVQLLGQQAGETMDTVVRNAIITGTNVSFAGGRTEREDLTATDKITVDDIFKVVRKLKNANAKKINDSYVCILHPDVAYDLMRSTDFIDCHKYAQPEEIYEGEIGKIGGVRFVESTEAKIWAGEDDDCPEGLAVYACLFLGQNAYGVTEIEGGGLETIIKQNGSAGTADPLNQRSTVGWKGMKTAKILSESFMVRYECVSSFSATASAN